MNPKNLLLFLSAGLLCFAGKDADLKPAAARPGKVMFESNLSGGQLAKPWTVAKGEWQIKDGVIVGREKKEDKHNAVLSLNLPNRNSITRVSFKLDGADTFHLSYNHAKGHLFRVIVLPTGISLNKDKDTHDPNSKGAVLAKSATKFETGKWYTLMVEVQGDKVVVQTDNGVKLEGSEAGLDKDKVNIRFVTHGQHVNLAGVKVWQTAD